MKYLIYPIIICFIVFGNVNKAIADTIKNELKHYKKIDLPYSSNETTEYYYWKGDDYVLYISPNPKIPIRFSAKEYAYTPKLVRLSYKNSFYYPAIYFNYKNILYKGIIYMVYGTYGDDAIFFFQLNSYDKQGNFIDAITLDERLNAEGEALWWSDFKIQADGRITVNKMEQMLIDDNGDNLKAGDIHVLAKIEYQMGSSGTFKKIKETVIRQR
ncbi:MULTISPECIES: hypothetical protein [unclassified Snodgrassella]|uniref:hypothetical protein n=1 Tax=unclassified Snodgrassella TaxID=2625236 RepID=UPI0018DE8AFB|nr:MULTISPECIES: hypothetical protein [unclassified Snodgrassella]MBI0068152.1 hypothetical protein [Snodgrassella sp. M0110]MBI0077207.1 hypothetical protein [Snodgrassella sp. M0118]MBI0079452.1 hypothetical protein [Snodgrassella sp. M0112]